MKTIISGCVVASIAATPCADVTIEHGVESGTVITKTLTHSATYELTGGLRSADGETEEMPDDFGMSLEHTVEVLVTDTYGSREEGALASLTRVVDEYSDELEGEVVEEFGTEEVAVELESELVGEAVVWTRDEGREWTAAYADEESDLEADLLDGLTFDLDGLGLLPPADADLEAGWSIPVSAFAAFLGIGGDLGGAVAGDVGDSGNYLLRSMCLMPSLGELDGDITLALDAFDEDTGLATLAVAGECANDVDALALMRRLTRDESDPELDALESIDIEGELEFEGEVVWNVTDGHLDSFEITADFERLLILSASMPGMGEMSFELEFEGDATWTGACAVR